MWSQSNKDLSRPSIAVYTCVTGGYDDLCPPDVITPGVDYICFNDGGIQVPIPWQSIQIACPYSGKDANRYLKILPHLTDRLAQYDLTIYVDGAIKVIGDLTPLIEKVMSLEGHTFMYEHPHRKCIYAEGMACVISMKAPMRETAHLLEKYRREGMPRDLGLFECGVIVRKSRANFESLMATWWQNYLTGVRRDQLALAYTIWRAGGGITSLGAPDHRNEHRFFCCKEGHKRDALIRYFAWWIWRPVVSALINLRVVRL